MHWLVTLLSVVLATTCLGEESIPPKTTLPQIPELKTPMSKTSESNTLLTKTSITNTTGIGTAVVRTNQADTKGSVAKESSPTSVDTKMNLALSVSKTGAPNTTVASARVPCTCGIFLSGQLSAGSQQPQGFPPLLQEYDQPFACTPLGQRQCANKCLEVIAKHLRNSATIICGSLDRDCFKERAFLWTKNCNEVWENSHMSAGREYCCKDGLPYKCPLGKI